MSKRFARCLGFACTLLAAASCGSDSDSSGPSATVETPSVGAGAAGAPGSPAPNGEGAAPTGEVTPGESPDLETPLDNAGAGGSAGTDEAAAAGGGAPPVAAAGAGGAAPDAAGSSPFPASVTRPKIMIVGDSISAGPGCYKKYLLADLNAAGYTNFDFVGQYTDDCGGGVMHSARSCTTALDYTLPTFDLRADCGGGTFPGLATLMVTFAPDLLMLQLGVNDVWNGLATDAILANYATLLEQARAQNPNVVIAIAQIQQIRPTGDANPDAVFARAQALVEALPAWAQAQSQPTSPVFVADLWTSSSTTQTLDGVHPDEPGAERMGQNWFEALRNILSPG
jgi:GDSL-like lipase/acylhydrolase family protein